jgi:hypothetical protein
MTHRHTLCAVAMVTLAGCGGGGDSKPSASPSQTRVRTAASATAQLEQAVRLALRENGRLSIFVLAHNRIPAWATRSTRGPALAALRSSAATRRRHRVRVRSLSDRLEILHLRIDPSYATATATVRDRQRVLPYRHGRPDRPPKTLDERVRVELHRLRGDVRFVVWRVLPTS